MNRIVAGALALGVLTAGCASPSTSAPSSLSFDPIEQNLTQGVQLDRSKPVPPKTDVINAWQKRQDAIKTARFVWTEQQTRPVGWLPNARFPERDRLAIPALISDRTFMISKSLSLDGNKLRYSFELDRKEEPDGVRVKSPDNRPDGLGVRRSYSYLSVFDGQVGKTTLTTRLDGPPPAAHQTTVNVDAQNLDTRAILLAFRPLDPAMGHLLLDRAVTNQMRQFYKGKSTFLLEERHDPSGWKTILWIEPERDFLISRYDVLFEQKLLVMVDIDYSQDARWGWVPNAWHVTEMLADGSKRLVAEAKVSSFSINEPIGIEEFR